MVTSGTVLEHAIAVAEQHGLHGMTRERVSLAAGVSSGTVSNRFGGMQGLLDEVVQAALARGLRVLICQAVAMRHPIACEKVKRWPNGQKLELLQSVL